MILGCNFIQLFEHIRFRIIIRFHDSDVLAFGHIKTAVHGITIAAVRFCNHLNSAVFIHILPDNGRRRICRTIIHTYNFNIF